MGPFVDSSDAVTPETGVTLGAADQAEVLKANGAATVAMSGTFAAVTGADGWYDYTVQTGDVDTVGEVVLRRARQFGLPSRNGSRPGGGRGHL